MKRAKRLHRPYLKDWEQDGLNVSIFPRYVEGLEEESKQYQYFIPEDEKASKNLPVVLDSRILTKEEFWGYYEAKEIPCVIKGIPGGYDSAKKTKEWPAVTKWEIQELEKDSHLSDRLFKCGEDDDGKKIKVKLKYFMEYLRKNADDSPLYVFDSTFDEDRYAKKLLSEYKVPSYFADDLFRFISESRRPPYRWFLVGPERSGTCVHVDPLSTR